MRIAVCGARGMLGRQLTEAIRLRGWEALEWVRPTVDISNVSTLLSAAAADRPDIIVNCAAWTDVDGAETAPDAAFLVNHYGAKNIAACASTYGARCIHISTDFVYPGTTNLPLTEDALPAPQSIYGASKLQGDLALTAVSSEAVIIRTGYVFGHHGPNLIDKIASTIRAGHAMSFVDDQWITPTSVDLLVESILSLATSNASGVFHVAQSGSCSVFELASNIASLVGHSSQVSATTRAVWEPLQQARCEAVGRKLAPRPIYSVLNCEKAQRVLDRTFPNWLSAIRTYFGL